MRVLPSFVKVMPRDYRRVLQAQAKPPPPAASDVRA